MYLPLFALVGALGALIFFLIYRIVGKYSSHSPSRACEEPDGFGWW
ncbi:MAG TPA: hypothetical protein VE954_37790 [Oligoflexus sp.]|nr:hypothetical protein [Oligoflexus sp.]HYX38894.1 hypothetical protein [Oligoflexus sp.]